MAKDGEAINRALEDVRQALDAWVFEPANWNDGIAAEVTMTLSERYPERLSGYIQGKMNRSLAMTHVIAELYLDPKRIEMHSDGRRIRLFQSVKIRVRLY